MNSKSASRLAMSLFVACVLLTAGAVAMQVMNLSAELPEDDGSRVADMIEYVTFLLFPLVGALIASRRPSNSIGWVILAATTIVSLDSLLGEYALRGLVVAPGSVPAADFAAWLYQWLWIVPIALLPVLFLVFPTGRTQRPAGRWMLVPAWVGVFLVAGPVAVLSWPHRGRALLLDPDAIPELGGAEILQLAAFVLILASLILAVVSLLVRWRNRPAMNVCRSSGS